MKAAGRIRFDSADVNFSMKRQRQIKLIIREIFADSNLWLSSLQYVFCSDVYLIDLNRRFLKHDTYTDIITFALSSPGDAIAGEIYISIDRVRENAQSLAITVESELARVIFHGALHLCGFKDKMAAQKKAMRSKEDFYLSKFL